MKIKLNKNQILEISKYWFDLSKLTFASLILKLFEPGSSNFNTYSIATVLLGLIATIVFVMMGIIFSGKTK